MFMQFLDLDDLTGVADPNGFSLVSWEGRSIRKGAWPSFWAMRRGNLEDARALSGGLPSPRPARCRADMHAGPAELTLPRLRFAGSP